MTPAGIEPATFRFVAQHLNHYATAVPLVTGISTKKKSQTHSRVFIFREVPLFRIHRFGNFPFHLSSKTLPYVHIPPNLFLAATLRNFLSPTHIHPHSRRLHKQIYSLFFLFLFTNNHTVSSQAMACQDSREIFVKRSGIKVH